MDIVILSLVVSYHLDNTNAPCRNGGRSVSPARLDHDACDRCNAVFERLVKTENQ